MMHQTRTTPLTIAELNDAFRRCLGISRAVPGRALLTSGVAALPEHELAQVLRAVQAFAAFTPGNDPWKEHDYGRVEAGATIVLFKFDYFADASLTTGAESGLDCYRVLTIMLPEEY